MLSLRPFIACASQLFHSFLLVFFASGLGTREELVGVFLLDQLDRAVRRAYEETGRYVRLLLVVLSCGAFQLVGRDSC